MIRLYDLSPRLIFIILIIFLSEFFLVTVNFIINLAHIKKKFNSIYNFVFFLLSNICLIITIATYGVKVGNIKAWDTYPKIYNTPLYVVIIGLVLLMLFDIFETIKTRRFLKDNLSAMSIKESLDELAADICYYDESGLVLFSNIAFNEDAQIILNNHLLNGVKIWDILSHPIENKFYRISVNEKETIVVFQDGRVKKFQRFEHLYQKEKIYEIIGNDIHEEYQLYQTYQSKMNQLKEMNEELRKYGEDIEKLTIEKEMLRTKIKIHNDLGKLLVLTKLSINEKKDKKEILNLWKENTQAITIMNRKEKVQNNIEDLISVGEKVGLDITYSGYSPKGNTEIEKIISNAVHTCMINALIHADATTMHVDVKKIDHEVYLEILNNGKTPEEKVVEGGGLSSLRNMVESSRGKMRIESFPRFKLILNIPSYEIKGDDYE